MRKRIYVCHTYYHVYIACLKELAGRFSDGERAALLLSTISTDFSDLQGRLSASGLYSMVEVYDEKPEAFFPELKKYRASSGGFFKKMINRLIFTKKFAKAQESYLPVDFREYGDIYVFCDSDPIGYYLNYAKIPYHALEDGLDCLAIFNAAHFDNRGFFRLKAFLASLNLIFIQNGYSKYCLDMEVNDISAIERRCPKLIEKPRKELVDALDAAGKETLLKIFLSDIDALREKLDCAKAEPKVLVLTEPLCDLETREKLFRDLIDQYGQLNGREAQIYIKPHPIDKLDYRALFPQHTVLPPLFPMEILNFIEGLRFDRAVSVLTATQALAICEERIKLGPDFLDSYQDPKIHRWNEQI